MAKIPGVLPLPRKVKALTGRFALTRQSPIVLSPSCDEADRFAADLLRKQIEKRASMDLAIEKHARATDLAKPICIVRLADLDGGGFGKVSGGEALAKQLGPEGYIIDATPERLILAAHAPAGIYYGVQTLRQMFELTPGHATLDAATIADWPDFRYRGVMHDVSRGKVPRLDTLFRLVEILGVLKVNVLQLYTEHTFAFRRHPTIGRVAGSFSSEDMLALDEHARRHHVELQPNLQSFGHMKHILALTAYAPLAESESGWTLAPGKPETYEFLADLYAEFLPCFGSRIFNADCDETYDLGKGMSRKRAEKLGVGRVYVDHVRKLRALASRHGKRLAVWGDVLLKHPKELTRLPKDVIVLNWGYNANHHFDSSRKFKRAGVEHWVCPGAGTWNSLAPRVETACANIANAARSGKRTGATGLLNTDWGDNGHPNLLGQSFHAFAFGAEAAWSGPPADDADFDKRFSWSLFRDRGGLIAKIYRALDRINAVFGAARPNSPIFGIYWAEFPDGEAFGLATPVQMNRCERLAISARARVSKTRQLVPGQRALLDELDFAARQTIIACRKARVARAIRKAVPQVAGEAGAGFGGKGLPAELVVEVAELHREWRLQRDEFERLWMSRSRRSEIEIRLRLYREREQELARLAEPSARRPDLD